jgi:hypothetical protein
MEVALQWLDELDDLVYGLALLWEPLRRMVLQIGFAAALMLQFAPSVPNVAAYAGVLAGTALTCVLVWSIALLGKLAARGKRAAGAALA